MAVSSATDERNVPEGDATCYFHTYESPLGSMLLLANDRALTGLYFVAQRYYPSWDPRWVPGPTVKMIVQAIQELSEYFAGTRSRFDTPIELQGTAFQRKVWAAIGEVGCGETISYTELARRCGCADSARAVGAATGRNRISIIVPCHRIVGAGGKLTGYAGGLDKKKSLLTREGAFRQVTGQQPLFGNGA